MTAQRPFSKTRKMAMRSQCRKPFAQTKPVGRSAMTTGVASLAVMCCANSHAISGPAVGSSERSSPYNEILLSESLLSIRCSVSHSTTNAIGMPRMSMSSSLTCIMDALIVAMSSSGYSFMTSSESPYVFHDRSSVLSSTVTGAGAGASRSSPKSSSRSPSLELRPSAAARSATERRSLRSLGRAHATRPVLVAPRVGSGFRWR
mmetsp:Transcript_19802/g.64375  ORF Transcript_19802/g.64375 Transcript_19802/m.64375 type:complete len:204 (+) Transcript_19802:742-1353(+)